MNMNTKRQNYTVEEQLSGATILSVCDKDGKQIIKDGDIFIGKLLRIDEVFYKNSPTATPSPCFALLDEAEYNGVVLPVGSEVKVSGYAFTDAYSKHKMKVGSDYAFHFLGRGKTKGGQLFNNWSLSRITWHPQESVASHEAHEEEGNLNDLDGFGEE